MMDRVNRIHVFTGEKFEPKTLFSDITLTFINKNLKGLSMFFKICFNLENAFTPDLRKRKKKCVVEFIS